YRDQYVPIFFRSCDRIVRKVIQNVLYIRKELPFLLFNRQNFSCLLKCMEDELCQRKVDGAVIVVLETWSQRIQFGWNGGKNVILVVAPTSPVPRLRPFHVGHQKFDRFLDRGECPVLQELFISGIEIVP